MVHSATVTFQQHGHCPRFKQKMMKMTSANGIWHISNSYGPKYAKPNNRHLQSIFTRLLVLSRRWQLLQLLPAPPSDLASL